MNTDSPQYVVVAPASLKRSGLLGPVIKLGLAAILISFLSFSSYLTWQWAERNLLHWGIDDSKTTQVDQTGLLERLQVFQVVSVKDKYVVRNSVDIDKALSVGPARVSLPGWVAGQNMHTSGEVMVSAGIDLGSLKAEDIAVRRQGQQLLVVTSVPGPQIISAELVPNTMNIENSQGLLTRLKTRLGFNEKDLRDQAADGLVRSAINEAASTGLLHESGRQVQSRLAGLFANLPHAANETVTYEIQFKPRIVG